jgi:hypothetical protein
MIIISKALQMDNSYVRTLGPKVLDTAKDLILRIAVERRNTLML